VCSSVALPLPLPDGSYGSDEEATGDAMIDEDDPTDLYVVSRVQTFCLNGRQMLARKAFMTTMPAKIEIRANDRSRDVSCVHPTPLTSNTHNCIS
jgi:hypothetical protein